VCFSAEADLVAGTVVTAIGVDAPGRSAGPASGR
jgi:hypothetical protein